MSVLGSVKNRLKTMFIINKNRKLKLSREKINKKKENTINLKVKDLEIKPVYVLRKVKINKIELSAPIIVKKSGKKKEYDKPLKIKKLNISKNNNKQEKRIVNTNEVAIDDCYAGVIENEFIDTLEYEVYVFVEYKKEVVSPLLYKAFKDKESAKEYYDELNSIIKCKNLGDLRVKCQN